jgi:hypothetical protein
MALVRLYRPHVTWALAYENAFADPADPTVAELNDDRFVHFISCALTEDGTEFVKDDSDTDDTVTYCDIGQVETPTRVNYSASLQWLLDANTGGSGSTADTDSIYNKTTALLGREGIRYWLIQRIGPGTIAQDSTFAVGQIINMGLVETDLMQYPMASGSNAMGLQNLLSQGQLSWNFAITTAS